MSIRFCSAIILAILLSSCELLDDFIDNKNNQGDPKDELASLFESEYVDGYSAILIEDGYALLSKANKLCLAKYDFISEKWSNDTLCSVELDSLGRTSIVYLQNEVLSFYNYSDRNVSIAHIVGDDYQIYENLDFIQENSRTSLTKSTRSENESGVNNLEAVIKTITGTVASMDLAVNVVNNPKSIKTALSALGYVSGFAEGLLGVAATEAGMALNYKFAGAIPHLLEAELLLIEAGRALSQKLTEELIGDWNVNISSAQQITADLARVHYTISGVKDNHSVKLTGNLLYRNLSENSPYTTVPIEVQNGDFYVDISLKGYGEYLVEVSLTGSWGFFKRDSKSFQTIYLALDKISYSDEYQYADGNVYYDVSANIRGDGKQLTDYEEYGIYFRNTKTNEAYTKKSVLSNIFKSTEVTFSFYVNKEDYENINYSSFVAKSSMYRFGVYAKSKKGNYLLFDEKTVEFVYNKSPKVTICNLQQGAIYSIDTDGYDRKAEYSYNISVEGGLFIDSIYKFNEGEWVSPGISGYVSTIADGDYNTVSTYVIFDSEHDPHTTYIYYIANVNGSERRSNSIIYSFNGGNCSIYLGGSTKAGEASIVSKKQMKLPKNNNMMHVIEMRKKPDEI